MSKADRLRALIPSVYGLYWAAHTRAQERDAYRLLMALGCLDAYAPEAYL